MHTIPFWSEAVKKELYFNENAQIVGCELAQTFDGDLDPEKPYEAMAKRLVYHALNGSASRRIQNGIRCAKEAGATAPSGLITGAVSTPLESLSLPKRNSRRKGFPFCSWMGTDVTGATAAKDRPLLGWGRF